MLEEDRGYSLDEFSKDLKKMYDHILFPDKNLFEKGHCKKVHINFKFSFIGQTLRELNVHEEEFIVTFEDNFAVAPIRHLEKEDGQRERFDWIKDNLNKHEGETDNYYFDKFQRTISELVSIPENIPITIWVSENANEQIGLLFTMYLLRERKNKISIINTGQLYKELLKSKSKKHVPFFSGGIIPEELQAIYTSV